MQSKKRNNAIRLSRTDLILEIVIVIITLLVTFLMIYPMYFSVIASVSDPYEVVRGNVYLWPRGFTLDSYRAVFSDSRIWQGYANTIFYTAAGTLLSLVLTIPCAYGLSKKRLVGHSLLGIYFLIPMYFGGGMIPTYLQIKSLGLLNQRYTLIVLGCVSIYNMVVTRVYFQSSIPSDLYESARIDGASEGRMFFRIALPLAKPIIAVMALFYAVGRWNNYFTALLYVSKTSYQPLQIVLRNILLMSQTAMSALDAAGTDEEQVRDLVRLAYLAESMKYALIFIASAPLLIAYPFVQKYFVKGMMIGALKG